MSDENWDVLRELRASCAYSYPNKIEFLVSFSSSTKKKRKNNEQKKRQFILFRIHWSWWPSFSSISVTVRLWVWCNFCVSELLTLRVRKESTGGVLRSLVRMTRRCPTWENFSLCDNSIVQNHSTVLIFLLSRIIFR